VELRRRGRFTSYNIGSEIILGDLSYLPRRAPDAGQVALFGLELEAVLCAHNPCIDPCQRNLCS
jgi:hypothetical protein